MKEYKTPEITIIQLETEDIITWSLPITNDIDITETE